MENKDLRNELIGQREGIQFALDELTLVAKSLQDRIKRLDEEIEKIGD